MLTAVILLLFFWLGLHWWQNGNFSLLMKAASGKVAVQTA